MVGTNGRTFEAQNPEDSKVNQNGFAGVDPIYQNFANETDKPLDDPADAKAAEERGTKLSDKPNEVQPADEVLSGKPVEEKPAEEEKPSEETQTDDKSGEQKVETQSAPAPAAKSTSTKK